MRARWTAAAAAVFGCSCAPLPSPVPPAPPPAGAPAPAPVPTAEAPAPPPARLQGEPLIDVGLAWNLDSLVVEPGRETGFEWTGPGTRHEPARSASVLRLRVSGVRAVAWGPGPAAAGVTALDPGDTLWVGEPGPRAAEPVLRWNGRTWRGRFKVFLNPRGRLTLAARLPIESYLLGVVPGEIGSLSEELIEAGRAQAIAARSYTLFYVGRRAAEGFDLYATVEDQVYGPVDSERPLATLCVEGTRGQVALSGGRPIRANYCSTCGGITAEVWEAWPADPLPYLVSRRDHGSSLDYCEGSSHYRWRERWPVAEFLSNVARFGPPQGVGLPPGGLGQLVDVRAESRSRSGRVWRLRVLTTTGEVVIPAYSIRQVLRRPANAGAILRSSLFKVDVRRDPATRRALEVVASGAGSGHGVGLCQTGALGMARAGRGAEEILEHYYRGARVRHAY